MRCHIELDSAALRHNVSTLAAKSAPAAPVPIVKANAYGHGLREIAQILIPMHLPWLGVNYLSEGEDLRRFGYKGRILCVGPLGPDELKAAAAHDIDVFIGNFTLLKAYATLDPQPRMHVKIDTGMGRQGFVDGDIGAAVAYIKAHALEVTGVCSHFANVEDVTKQDYATLQLRRFSEAVAAFHTAGYKPLCHIASSASTIIMNESRFDLTRFGISTYGVWPSQATRISYQSAHQDDLELRPVLTWVTEISALKTVRAGEFIGYGCTYRTTHPMTIAVLPVGYYEGYPRIAGDKSAYVLLHGQRCPLVGRICMNMMMVDVSHAPGAAMGDRVTLIGQDGDETLEATSVADWADTIHYELFTRLNPAMPRLIR